MAYLIEGEHKVLVYCANYRVGSVATGNTLINMGAIQQGGHHGTPDVLPPGSVVAQTVRSHFDVIVSFWFKDNHHCLTEYVEMILDGHHRFLRPDGFYSRFPWDFVMMYNTLQHEFDQLCLYVGLPQTTLDAGPRNKSTKPTEVKAESLFSDRLKQKVIDRYGHELEKIGYGIA